LEAAVAQERTATTEEQARRVAQLQVELQDRDRRLFEQEQSISLLLRYIDEHERALGAEIAATTERDWKIAALEKQLSRGRWQRIRAGATSLLRGFALQLYRVVVPGALRLKLWERRHPHGPEARLAEMRDQGQSGSQRGSGQVQRLDRLSVAIVTRNGVHGGVETMVALHQQRFNATVFVAGGQNRPDTCPFPYTYIDAGSEVAARQRLASSLLPFDVVIYHWIPGWAQAAIRDAGVACIEVVHREDTSDNDKTIPTLIVTHSEYLAAFLHDLYSVEARVIPHGVDTDRFQPARPNSDSGSGGGPTPGYVGAITSYHSLKGVDLFLSAWDAVGDRYPQYRSRFYGSGPELTSLRAQAETPGLLGRAEILGPTAHPEAHITEFRLFVVPSRAEGMPFAVLEALAANVPVLASDLAPMQEFNDIAAARGCGEPLILFERDNLSDLSEKLDACLGGQSLGREDTRSYITHYFSLEEHCEQYRSAMEHAVALHASLASPALRRRD
jgi:glycosyltransferase involved in cell wall biosynthesis